MFGGDLEEVALSTPRSATSDMTRRSRMGSMGGFVT